VESGGREDRRDANALCGCKESLDNRPPAVREETGGDGIDKPFHERERRRYRSGLVRPSMA